MKKNVIFFIILAYVLLITTTYYEMGDGSWKIGDFTYKFKLELTGKLDNAEKDTTYIVLSNKDDITFEQAWKASGLSSDLNDYFDAKDTKIVAIYNNSLSNNMC